MAEGPDDDYALAVQFDVLSAANDAIWAALAQVLLTMDDQSARSFLKDLEQVLAEIAAEPSRNAPAIHSYASVNLSVHYAQLRCLVLGHEDSSNGTD